MIEIKLSSLTDKILVNNKSIERCIDSNFNEAKGKIKNLNNVNFDNLMNSVFDDIGSKSSMERKEDITRIINSFCIENRNNDIWKSELYYYAKSNKYVDMVTSCINYNDGKEFLVVANCPSFNNKLEITDFCFSITDKNENIDNFMVLDNEEYECIEDSYKEVNILYKRG